MRQRSEHSTLELSLRRADTLRAVVGLVASLGACVAALGACATDNGPSAYGETFGPLPERRDGGLGLEDGGSVADGAPTPDAGSDAATSDASTTCTSGTLAVLAGSDAALAGAVQDKGGAWVTSTVQGASKSLPALVATTTGFVGAVRSTNDVLAGVTFATSWSSSAIGAATTIGSPSLHASGATVHLSLLTPSFEHAYGAYAQGTWSGANEALQPTAGVKSFGPSPGSVAEPGGDVVVAFDGQDGGLYVQSRAAGAWASASPVAGAGVYKPVPPVLVAWDGTSDLLVLFADDSQDHVLRHAVRASGTKTWSGVKNTGALAFTPEAFRAARISPSQVVVTYRGGDGRAYAMVGTFAADAFTWAAPAPLLGGATVDSAPAVAKGVCGDEAVAAVATGGAVKVVRLRGGAWSAAETVPNLSGARVAIAAR